MDEEAHIDLFRIRSRRIRRHSLVLGIKKQPHIDSGPRTCGSLLAPGWAVSSPSKGFPPSMRGGNWHFELATTLRGDSRLGQHDGHFNGPTVGELFVVLGV